MLIMLNKTDINLKTVLNQVRASLVEVFTDAWPFKTRYNSTLNMVNVRCNTKLQFNLLVIQIKNIQWLLLKLRLFI